MQKPREKRAMSQRIMIVVGYENVGAARSF
jgi:hypothetical protein